MSETRLLERSVVKVSWVIVDSWEGARAAASGGRLRSGRAVSAGYRTAERRLRGLTQTPRAKGAA
ncbi:hypothetical protein GCM10022199_25060 [Marihabitans asiaticum]